MDPSESPTALATAARGVAALHALWARLGLPGDTPEVLSNRGSLMVRMPLAGVVARVSTHTGWQRRDQGWWLGIEVAVGRLAVAAGAPVVPPSEDPPAGPHAVDGLWVSIWNDMGSGGGIRPTAEQVAGSLVRWHRSLAGAGPDLPVMTVAHQVVTEPLEHAVTHGFLTPDEHAALVREHAQALAGIEGRGSEEVVLHGDAHRGNLLRDPCGGWVWNDLEEACRGPVEWDLAVLGSTPSVDPGFGRRALAAYCRITGREVPSDEELAPWLRLRALEANAWAVGCAVTFPERYAEPARRFVAEVVAGAGRA